MFQSTRPELAKIVADIVSIHAPARGATLLAAGLGID